MLQICVQYMHIFTDIPPIYNEKDDGEEEDEEDQEDGNNLPMQSSEVASNGLGDDELQALSASYASK
jgi:hypothetical protein